jgi:uncharacterized protein YjgD (DUF1641 family)
VAFLLSDESSYITGAEIAIDGASSAPSVGLLQLMASLHDASGFVIH